MKFLDKHIIYVVASVSLMVSDISVSQTIEIEDIHCKYEAPATMVRNHGTVLSGEELNFMFEFKSKFEDGIIPTFNGDLKYLEDGLVTVTHASKGRLDFPIENIALFNGPVTSSVLNSIGLEFFETSGNLGGIVSYPSRTSDQRAFWHELGDNGKVLFPPLHLPSEISVWNSISPLRIVRIPVVSNNSLGSSFQSLARIGNFTGGCEVINNDILIAMDIRSGITNNWVNVNSNRISITLPGNVDFDVSQVDQASLKLEETIVPISFSSALTDYTSPVLLANQIALRETATIGQPDGYADLTFKVSTSDLLDKLRQPLLDKEVYVLTLTGELLNGQKFRAQDYIYLRL